MNGIVPGPEIRIPMGARVLITLVNELSDYSTIHFHGIDQSGTPSSDGVINYSQCSLSNSPGNNTMQYTFTANTVGTYWYHGHVDEQYVDGFVGALIVTDNNTANPSRCEKSIIIADWYQSPAHGQLKSYFSPQAAVTNQCQTESLSTICGMDNSPQHLIATKHVS